MKLERSCGPSKNHEPVATVCALKHVPKKLRQKYCLRRDMVPRF
jgi:hypothetical protein